MNKHGFIARLAAGAVAAVAATVSFQHLASVAVAAGEQTWVSYLIPLSIDGLIVVGVSAMLEDRQKGNAVHMWGKVSLAVGVIATLAGNLASAENTNTARVVAIAAPISFWLSIHTLTRGSASGAVEVSEQVLSAPAGLPASETLLGSTETAEQPPEVPMEGVEVPGELEPAVQPASVGLPVPGPGRPSTRDRVMAARRTNPEASTNRIAELAGVARSTARRHLNGSGEYE